MQIYVIRHGETEWNKEEIFRGRKDIPLNETGKRQAEWVGLYFSEKRIDRLVSSPLSRAMQTAEPIGKATGAAVEPMEEFTDINFGIWEGLLLREVEERYPSDLKALEGITRKIADRGRRKPLDGEGADIGRIWKDCFRGRGCDCRGYP